MLSESAARVLFLIVQKALAVHFRGVVVLAAALFAAGVLACLYTFVKAGCPVAEVNPSATPEYA